MGGFLRLQSGCAFSPGFSHCRLDGLVRKADQVDYLFGPGRKASRASAATRSWPRSWPQATFPGRAPIPPVGLDPFVGRPTTNSWRAILAGEANLLAPTPPPESLLRQTEPSPVRVFKDGRLAGPGETLWR